MADSKFRLTNPLRFFIERQFVKGAQYQLLAVVALIGLISLSGGVLAYLIEHPQGGINESIWWAFLRLTDPGYLGDDEGTWLRVVSTFLTISGYVVFLGALVAIMTQSLKRKMEELEQGLTPVAVKNHIVILGWTDRTPSIVVELFQSEGKLKRFLARFGAKKLRLVILAENSSAKLTQELKADRLIGKRAEEIILRTGDPLQADHLLRVDCYNASAIIIPSRKKNGQNLLTADVETIKTLLSLSSNPKIKEQAQLPYVVAEIQDAKKLPVARRSYPGPLEVVSGDSIISRLITQNIRHAGLSKVYRELLSRAIKSDIYTRHHGELTGKKIFEIEPLFPNCIVLGIVKTTEAGYLPMLNVRDDVTIEEKDRIIFLADTHEDTNPLKGNRRVETHDVIQPEKTRDKKRNEGGKGTRRTLIFGWNSRIPSLIEEMGTYKDIQFNVTITSILPAEERIKRIKAYGADASKVACTHVEADFIEEAQQRALNPQNYDQILFMSSDMLADGEEADARTIVGKIILDNILDEHGKNSPNILLELANAENHHLIKSKRSEVIISPMILSHLLAQVALRRELQSIYTELFTAGGAEIEFRKHSDYNLSDGSYVFSDLENKSATYSETAIGVFKSSTGDGSSRLILNPGRGHEFNLTAEDRLVVLMSY
ncbi:MAG: ion channel DMI1 [Bacteroidetes bacterium]|jgi:hypothetical protein|nr:ion channel DMI1 [Bacteroidota bacterium]